MQSEKDDAATALLRQLLEQHPEATDEEMWELFKPTATHDDEVRAAIKELHLKTFH